MTSRRPTPERLELFSDAVFAVIITTMILELKLPQEPSFSALLPLWPTALSHKWRQRCGSPPGIA